MLTDSHCHLASHKFEASEVADLIARARENGVSRLVSLATCLDDIEANLAASSHAGVSTCLGIHPCDVHHAPDDAVEKIRPFTEDIRVCGIGETGLDYYHPAPDGWDEASYHERQREFLHQHFKLAADTGLNVVIHTRDREGHSSFEDALQIYRQYHHTTRAVFHCFIGPWENARQVLDLGGLVSFGGVATFKSAKEVRDTVANCPAGSFMVETDAPYLAPEPYRGKRNEPAYVRQTAEFIAKLRSEPLEELAAHTSTTASAFFRIRPDSL